MRAAGGPHAILRTSWVVSAHGANFVKTMLRLGAERDRLTIVADQVGGPTPAADIAQACLEIAGQLIADPGKSGTYHFSGGPDVSWADFAREIFAQEAFQPFAGAEIQPGADVQSDAELDGFIREHVESAYHPCGTCRMGAADDPMAVVDGELKVRGLSGLRVIDASVMPSITSGNTNAPTVMIAEKGAEFVIQAREHLING